MLSIKTTPLQSARSMAESAMTIECEWFICLFIVKYITGYDSVRKQHLHDTDVHIEPLLSIPRIVCVVVSVVRANASEGRENSDKKFIMSKNRSLCIQLEEIGAK